MNLVAFLTRWPSSSTFESFLRRVTLCCLGPSTPGSPPLSCTSSWGVITTSLLLVAQCAPRNTLALQGF